MVILKASMMFFTRIHKIRYINKPAESGRLPYFYLVLIKLNYVF